jgi:hypothetical protein
MLLVKEEAAFVYLLLLAITDCQGHAGNKPIVCAAKAVVVLPHSSEEGLLLLMFHFCYCYCYCCAGGAASCCQAG